MPFASAWILAAELWESIGCARRLLAIGRLSRTTGPWFRSERLKHERDHAVMRATNLREPGLIAFKLTAATRKVTPTKMLKVLPINE
jgi:hypothetical protein